MKPPSSHDTSSDFEYSNRHEALASDEESRESEARKNESSQLKYSVPAQYLEHSDADSEPFFSGEPNTASESERLELEERIVAEAREVLSQQVIGEPLVPPRAPWHQSILSSLARNHGVLLVICTLLLWGVWSGHWPGGDRDLRVGIAAPRDLVAPRATSLLDREATRARREEAAALVTPEYDSEMDAQARALSKLDAVLRPARDEARQRERADAAQAAQLDSVIANSTAPDSSTRSSIGGSTARANPTSNRNIGNSTPAISPSNARTSKSSTRALNSQTSSTRSDARSGDARSTRNRSNASGTVLQTSDNASRAARRLKARLAARGVTLPLDVSLDAVRIPTARWSTLEIVSREVLRAAYFDDGRVQQIRSDVDDDLVLATARMKRSAARLLAGETSPQAADATSRTQSSTRSDRTARLALRNLSLSATDAKVALGLAQSVARVPNLVVNGARTQRARQEAQRDVAPVYRNIAPGTTLIAAGTVIDSEKWAQLQDLDLVAPRFDWITALSRLVLCALVVGFGAAFVARFSPLFAASVSSLWLLAIFPVLALALCRAALRVPFGESMVLPIVACAAMTLTILLDVRAGALCALGVSILLSALVQRSGGDGIVFTSVALGSMIAVLAIGEITSRMHLVKAGAVIALTHAALYAVTNGLRDSSSDLVTGALSSAALAAGATVVAAGLAMFLERPFGITTHLSLLELSSPDEPIMRRMQGEAPGTYTHSLMVAQLAEAGAKAVCADSLLCRVGGLYHDIGKLRRPHCFVENQHGVNVHDRLSPQLSALLIVSHVKDGLTLARALRPPLPRPVQDIIAQHHGRSLVSYFYHRALKDAHEMASIQTSSTQSSTRSPNALAVDESLFRYPGPRPQSKEAAIVMLADSVEASSRSLPDLTPEKLAEHIRHMIESRLREGELDDCALTLRDLSTVERAFAHVLRGALHQRIEYPDPTRDFNASARGERRDDDWAKNAARDRSEKRNDEKRNNGKHPENRRNAPRRSSQTATNSLDGKARNEYSMKSATDERELVDTSAPAQASAQAQENKARVLSRTPSTRAPSKRDVRKATADALSSHVKRKENSDSPGDNRNGNHQNGAA